jgi:hypothetical protein
MKKRISPLMLAFAALMVVSCSGPEKMKKDANLVNTSCDPQVLEVRADVIEARYTMSFPEKYFHPKAVLEIIPVLVYEGGEVAGPAKYLQGEKVQGNNTTIPKVGGKITQPVKFDYKPGMEASHLELRATLVDGAKRNTFDAPYKIADGANITYKLVNTAGVPSLLSHNYQKVITQTKEAQILYVINQSNVRPKELSKQDVKELQEFLAAVDTDPRKIVKGVEIISAASPEGPLKINEPLSANRGKSAKSALDNITRKVKEKAPVTMNSIGEDWDGFKSLVAASDMNDKDLILRVLSMYSDPVVREREIKNMSNVYTILKDKVLPELRRSRMIGRVDWQNYTDTELVEMANADNVEGLDVEGLLYAATLVTDNNTKISLYTKAAEKYNDYRAYNNLAYAQLIANNVSAAKAALAKASNQNDASVKNNLGVVALREDRMNDAVKLFGEAGNNAEARYNLGITSIINGNYSDAVSRFNGSNSFNEALANVLNGDMNKATTILNNLNDGNSEYLKAVIAARKGDCSNVSTSLNSAYSKTPALKQRAAKDIEFAKCKNSI